jgi:hypothetical protein
MKEDKSIEASYNAQMQLRRESKFEKRIRMPNTKDRGNQKNKSWKLFQLMKGYKSMGRNSLSSGGTDIGRESTLGRRSHWHK